VIAITVGSQQTRAVHTEKCTHRLVDFAAAFFDVFDF